MRTPSAAASRNAKRSDGTYLSASRAMNVCRVTPTLSASACWVISPLSKRNRRIRLVRDSGFLLGIARPSAVLDEDGDRRQGIDEHERGGDAEPQDADRHGPVFAIDRGRDKN